MKRASVLCLLWFAMAHCAMAETVTLYLMDVPPFAIDALGQRGILGDVVVEAARRMGDTLEIIAEPSPRVLRFVPDKENVLVIPLARLASREDQFTWISHIINVERAFFTLDKRIDTFEQAKAQLRSIAVARDSAGHRILLEQGFDPAVLQIVNQGESAPRMLERKRFDAWYNPVLEAETLQDSLGIKRFVKGNNIGPTRQYLACSKLCDPKLVKRYESAIAAMQADGTVKKIIGKYIKN